MGSGGDCGCGCSGGAAPVGTLPGGCSSAASGRPPVRASGAQSATLLSPGENRVFSAGRSPPLHPWVQINSSGPTAAAGRRGTCDDTTLVPPMSRRPWRPCVELPGVPLDDSLEPPLGGSEGAPLRPGGSSPGAGTGGGGGGAAARRIVCGRRHGRRRRRRGWRRRAATVGRGQCDS